MNTFLKRNNMLLIAMMIVLSVTIYITSFVPTNNALEDMAVDNFYHITEAQFSTINHSLNSNVESTESISSRSFIRDELIRYKSGEISLSELYNSTYSKYYEGVEVIENATQAIRLVDGEILVDIGETNIDVTTLVDKTNNLTMTKYEITSTTDYEMVVYSPIYDGTEILGFDIIHYSFKNSVELITTSDTEIKFIESGSVDGLYELRSNYNKIYQTNSDIICIKEINDNYSLEFSTPKTILFEEINHVLSSNVVLTLVITFISGMIIYLISKKFTKDFIESTSKNHDYYKEKAMIDSLTKTYSRLFLDQFLMENTDNATDTTVVMTDVNNFKLINDEHGHIVGDEVLRYVGKCLKTSFRNNDYVIRYGGDEFIILVNNVNKETTINILKRINEIIKQNKEFPFEITLSYGISFVDKFGNLDKGIEEADKNLYINKYSNK